MNPTSIPGHARRSAAVLAILLGTCFSGAAQAQTEAERIRELERKLEKSLQMIEELSSRLRNLEKDKASPAAPATAPLPAARAQQQEARIDALEKNVGAIASGGAARRAELGIPLHGFADVGYERTTFPRDDHRKSGFALGNLDFFFTPNFGRVKLLAELVFEVNDEGGLATDLERLQLGYTFSDSLTVWMGRFHTPYGYWNAAFHHGAQIQTSITRPRFVDFEDRGGILPAHSVGLWATGRVAAGPGKLHYDAYVTNGGRIVDGVTDFNAARDDNSNKAVGGNLGYQFGGALSGLLVGVHALREDVNTYTAGALQARTRMALYGGYFYADIAGWEGIGEYYRFRNRDLSGDTGTHQSSAAFVQVGHTFLDAWTPYYRWEKTDLDQKDAYFAAQDSGRSYRRHVLGLRYNLNSNTAVKVEGNRTREFMGEDTSFTELRAQFSVRF
jgi:hypothetical protein